MTDSLIIAGREFHSRLILGSGKYESFELMKESLDVSGTEMVTVAVRRVNLTDKSKESLLDYINPEKYHILPNTAGCYSSEEAIRTAMLAREALDNNWIKLEVLGDERTLFPDNQGLLDATRVLVREGFIVLPYLNDDLIVARRLVDAGASAVMPLAAPIGSGLGIQNFTTLRILREQIREVPLIVDAGVGTASDATLAMELGVDGILMNSGIAGARDPIAMAQAMNYAVKAGRLAYEAGRIQKKLYASASSPVAGTIE
jgi:thiazole synthase